MCSVELTILVMSKTIRLVVDANFECLSDRSVSLENVYVRSSESFESRTTDRRVEGTTLLGIDTVRKILFFLFVFPFSFFFFGFSR